MANSRKSTSPSNAQALDAVAAFERALEAILARVVISAGDSIGIAYSGGLDSSVLLQLAADFCCARSIPLRACHVHHGLSANADDWLAHAQQRCEALAIPFDARRVNVTGKDEHGVEQAARLARYAALAEMCGQGGVRLLLTAHHQDDQAETVMLQWLRGAGLPGLSGMAALQDRHPLLPNVALARPLLGLSRADLEALAGELRIPHVTDESNHDSRYRRNALRNEVFPVIERHFAGFAETLVRSSRHAQAAQRLLDELARSDLAVCASGEGLDLAALRALSEDRMRNLVRYWLQTVTGRYPSEARLAQLQAQMLESSSDAHPRLEFDGWVIERNYRQLLASPAAAQVQPPSVAIDLVWRGEPAIEVPDWQGRLVFSAAQGPGLDRDALLAGPLSLRARSGGERLKLHPARPSRSLKHLFQESEVAAARRAWLPLLYVGQQLVFAAGLGVDVRARHQASGVTLRWEASGSG